MQNARLAIKSGFIARKKWPVHCLCFCLEKKFEVDVNIYAYMRLTCMQMPFFGTEKEFSPIGKKGNMPRILLFLRRRRVMRVAHEYSTRNL